MKTLLHICCAPCANQCIDSLRSEGIDLTGLWYNPNIHPFTEYRARRNCLPGVCRDHRPAAHRAGRLRPAALRPGSGGGHSGPVREVL